MFAGYKNVSIKSTYADEKQGGGDMRGQERMMGPV